MIFHDITLSLDGTIRSRRQQDTANLAPEAVRIFVEVVAEDAVSGPIPVDGLRHVTLRWSRAPWGGIVSFCSRGEHVTSSMLMIDDSADPIEHLESWVGRNGLYGALGTQRPLIVSAPFGIADIEVIADMETCFAAAAFMARIDTKAT